MQFRLYGSQRPHDHRLVQSEHPKPKSHNLHQLCQRQQIQRETSLAVY